MNHKYQSVLKNTETKYYNAIAEFRNIELQLNFAKEQEFQKVNSRIQELESEVT
jgi:hypothetical protein